MGKNPFKQRRKIAKINQELLRSGDQDDSVILEKFGSSGSHEPNQKLSVVDDVVETKSCPIGFDTKSADYIE